MQSNLIYNKELLEGRNAMVTGGATGLGRAIAVGLAQVGAKVTIVSRQEDVLSEAVKHISDQTGKSNILARLKEINIQVDQNQESLSKLIDLIKDNEFKGFSYDTAEASFELLARKTLQKVPEYFSIGRFRVMDERRFNAKGEMVVESEASVTLRIGENSFHEVAIGNGPVNAVDMALRKALKKIYPSLDDVMLVDYKVRIIDSGAGTEATTRVLIECQESNGDRWRSVGLSTNIIDASVMALSDALTWRLLTSGIEPSSPTN